MLQAARLAPSQLLEASGRVVEYLQGQFNDDGGVRNRAGESDLYYTVFALDSLLALQADAPLDNVESYLRGFGTGQDLDLVHQSCLARCWAAIPGGSLGSNARDQIITNLESCRTDDGGYGPEPGSKTGTVYHCFLALDTYQNLDCVIPNIDGIERCLASLVTDDGAYANEQDLKIGTTPTTAAAATLLSQLGKPVSPSIGQWLRAQCTADGGFLAMPVAPFPDLLSTATALHALAELGCTLNDIREPCLDYLDSLWTGKCFLGHQADDRVDCEYAFYALLALGHLST